MSDRDAAIAASLSRPTRHLLVRTFARGGKPDASSVSTNDGPRLCWEDLVEALVVRERAPSPFHRYSYELTPLGRAVLLALLRAPKRDEACAPRPVTVKRTCPDCRHRGDAVILRERERWVICPDCGHEWATKFRSSEVA